MKLRLFTHGIFFILAIVFANASWAELRLKSAPTNSTQIGTTVAFTPISDLGTGYIYQYRIKNINDASTTVLRDWNLDINHDWDTTGYIAGRYHLQLRAKLVNSSAPYDVIAYKSFELTANTPVATVDLDLQPATEQEVGLPVSINIQPQDLQGNAVSAEFRVLITDPVSGNISVARDWAASAYNWDTTGLTAGDYIIGVEARAVGSNVATYEAEKSSTFTLTPSQGVSVVTLDTSMQSPQTAGTSIVFTATSVPSTNVEYQFLQRKSTDTFFTVVRDWGVPTWTWDTSNSTDGVYATQVRARTFGSSDNFEQKTNKFFKLYGLRFQDVTQAAGLDYTGETWGGAWGDANGDGKPDLWITNHRLKPSFYINNGDGTFTDRIDELWTGIPYSDAHGTAWADVDNDGDQDFLQVAGGGQGLREVRESHYNQLFINNNGSFSDEAVFRQVSYEIARGRSLSWLDWNNDGLLDVFFTVENNGANPPNALFVQGLGGVFTDESAQLNFEPTTSNGWFAPIFHVGTDDSMYVMPGNWRVPRDVYAFESNITHNTFNMPLVSLGNDVATGDFDGDLVTDLFVARTQYNRHVYVYRGANEIDFSVAVNGGNHVGMTFPGVDDIEFDLIVPASLASGIHIGAGDLPYDTFVPPDITQNGDAPPHVVLTFNKNDPRVQGMADFSSGAYTFGVFIGYDAQTDTWTLISYNDSVPELGSAFGSIRSPQDLTGMQEINFDPVKTPPSDKILSGVVTPPSFVEKTGSGVEQPLHSESVVVGDFDNDMDLDIYVLVTKRIHNLPNALYLNDGSGHFQRMPGAGGAEGTDLGRGENVIMADYDSDGFLDLLTFNGRGEPPFNDGPRQLFRNLGNANHWMEIDLVGTTSNRDGIGAIVTLIAPNGKMQMRERDNGMHARGQNHKRIHFGLGPHPTGTVIVKWPSGKESRLQDVPANQILTITEP